MRAVSKSNNKPVEDTWGKPKIVIQDEERWRRNRWQVENCWGILKNMYQELNQRKFSRFSIENLHTIDELYAAIVQQWCLALAKEGLYKGYVTHEDEEMSQPQGQINVQQTIANQTLIRGQIVCSYDELSDDIYMNHVLKGTLQYFMQLDVSDEVKKEIKKAMVPFMAIGYVDMQTMKWKSIRYNNNTMRYKNLLDMCRWVYNEKKFGDRVGLTDDYRVYNLFKKGLCGTLNKLYGQTDTVDYFEMPYTYENEPEFETEFFKMQPLAVVSMKDLQLMYMVRLGDINLYNRDFQMPRTKLKELLECTKKYEDLYKDETVGVVIQINFNSGEYNVDGMNLQMMEDHMLGDLTVDIWDKWNFIETRLKDPYEYFIGRKKERLKRGLQK